MKTLTREDIDQMTEAEKLDLMDELWNSLEQNNAPLPPEQMAELERRLATFDEDIKSAITWEDYKAKRVSQG